MKNNILEFLRGDGNFTTNKKLVKKVGLINATIIQEIISYSFYAEKQGYYIEDDFFLYTKKNLQETGLLINNRRFVLSYKQLINVIQT